MEGQDRALGGGGADPPAEEAAVLVSGAWDGLTLLSVCISPLSSLNLEQYFVKYPDLDSAVFREIEATTPVPAQAGPATQSPQGVAAELFSDRAKGSRIWGTIETSESSVVPKWEFPSPLLTLENWGLIFF